MNIINQCQKENPNISLNNHKTINEPKGLLNINLNCYMNALLQCLYYIKNLRDFFINKAQNFKEDKPVCQALSIIMNGLKNGNDKAIDAKNLKEIMGNKNNLFNGFKGGDVKDFFINLIDAILTELSIDKIDKDLENEPNEQFTLIELYKEKLYNQIKEEIDESNIVNDLFLGYYEVKYLCNQYNININNYSFSTETFILFNLEKISKYYGKNQFTIEDCFEYNYNRSYETSFHCSLCQKIERNISEDKIYIPPKILVIILDRGKGKSFNGNVSFDNELNLKKYLDIEKENNKNNKYNSKYKLISVITHSGTSSSSGHYTACCLTDNGKYYYFNDQNADEIDNLLNYNGDPYILFYRGENENNQQNKHEVNNYDVNNYDMNNYKVKNCDANNYVFDNCHFNNYHFNNFVFNNFSHNNYHANNYDIDIFYDINYDVNYSQNYNF